MSAGAQQLALTIRLRERAVFDSYVPGSNLAAVEQLRSLARARQAAVVWLSGPRGVGKSHLLQASCALARSAGADGVYLPLAELVALGPEALEGWPRGGIVALDDVDAIAGREDWERGVFRLYRELHEAGATLLAAAEEVPQRLPFSLPDLASRFAAANLLPLRALDEADQRQALQLRARSRGLELPQETALYLQRRFRRDLPTLYQLLDAIDEASLQAQRRLTVPFIRQVLGQTPSELPE
ncbi:MAG TPA: DnaA regulatory inactivator Hda [Steroidobacteraceae bacterium]|jgi:DnaA family protein